MIVREDRPGDKRLVGYVTGTADPATVRARLGERLPGYMVPAAVVVVEALPLTVNGKLDHRALPAPEYTAGEYRAPSTAIEEILAGIYADVLGVERVGVDDSFFDLGGDSLSAMRLVAAINAGLDAGVSVRAVFEAPTVAQLAPRIGEGERAAGAADRRGASGGDSVVVRAEPAVVHRPVAGPLTGVQHAGGGAAERAPGCRGVGCGAGRCGGPPRMPAHACSRLPEGFPSRWSLPPIRPTSDGTSSMPAVGRQPSWSGPSADVAQHPFDLASEIPLRARLFRVSDDEYVLVAVVHHIAADGCVDRPADPGSGDRLCQPLRGSGSGLGCRWRCSMSTTRCGSARISASLDDPHSRIASSWAIGGMRWRGCLSGWCCRLIGRIRRWLIIGRHGGDRLARRATAAVRRVAREHDATSFMVVQAALAVLLASSVRVLMWRWGSRSPVAAILRWMTWWGCSSTRWCCGWIWVVIPPSPSCWVRFSERALAAYEHQDVPFEVLVDQLNPARSLAHHPLVQVMLAWQNFGGRNDRSGRGVGSG